jgi:DNA-binding NarL/FixJ family response regulator
MDIAVVLIASYDYFFDGVRTCLSTLPNVKRVSIATTLQEALYLCTSHSYNLLFVHHSLIEQVSASLPTFVVVTDSPTRQQAQIACQLGARGYIRANATGRTLERLLQEIEQGDTSEFFIEQYINHILLDEDEQASTLTPITDIESLSPREQEVFYLLHDGLRNKDIEKQLCIGEATVRTYVANIQHKLQVTRYQIPSLRLPERPTNSPPPRVTREKRRNDFWKSEENHRFVDSISGSFGLCLFMDASNSRYMKTYFSS